MLEEDTCARPFFDFDNTQRCRPFNRNPRPAPVLPPLSHNPVAQMTRFPPDWTRTGKELFTIEAARRRGKAGFPGVSGESTVAATGDSSTDTAARFHITVIHP
jgi:hypothetical protein